MAIFNSYVTNYQRVNHVNGFSNCWFVKIEKRTPKKIERYNNMEEKTVQLVHH